MRRRRAATVAIRMLPRRQLKMGRDGTAEVGGFAAAAHRIGDGAQLFVDAKIAVHRENTFLPCAECADSGRAFRERDTRCSRNP